MFRDLPTRHSIRFPDFDYSSPNWYYVTICTHERVMQLNNVGQIAKQYWQEVPLHYPFISLDSFVIMPNHVHGIIIINDKARADDNPPLHTITGTIGAIVRGYKIGVTKWCRQNTNIYELWQRNYWEHIIRDEGELRHVRKYIMDNPINWEQDKLFM